MRLAGKSVDHVDALEVGQRLVAALDGADDADDGQDADGELADIGDGADDAADAADGAGHQLQQHDGQRLVQVVGGQRVAAVAQRDADDPQDGDRIRRD